jgi:tyrosine-protein phosphatase YwqE
MAEYLLENDYYDFLGTDFHTLEQITFAKNHLFAEKYLKKIMHLVEANQFFSTK